MVPLLEGPPIIEYHPYKNLIPFKSPCRRTANLYSLLFRTVGKLVVPAYLCVAAFAEDVSRKVETSQHFSSFDRSVNSTYKYLLRLEVELGMYIVQVSSKIIFNIVVPILHSNFNFAVNLMYLSRCISFNKRNVNLFRYIGSLCKELQ